MVGCLDCRPHQGCFPDTYDLAVERLNFVLGVFIWLLDLRLRFGEDFGELMLERSFRDGVTLRKILILLECRLLFNIRLVRFFLSSPLVVVEEVLNLLHLGLDLLVVCRRGIVTFFDSSVSGLLD